MTGSCSKSLREFRLLKYIKNRMAQRVCTMEQICHRWSLFVSLPCSKINADFMAMGCMVLATQGLVGKIYPRLHSIHDLLVIPAPDSIWILLRQIGIHIFHDINDINLIYIYIYIISASTCIVSGICAFFELHGPGVVFDHESDSQSRSLATHIWLYMCYIYNSCLQVTVF